jgi:hypothetical protein
MTAGKRPEWTGKMAAWAIQRVETESAFLDWGDRLIGNSDNRRSAVFLLIHTLTMKAILHIFYLVYCHGDYMEQSP